MAPPQKPVADTAKTPVKTGTPLGGMPGGIYQRPKEEPFYQGWTARTGTADIGYADPMNATAGSYTVHDAPVQPRYFDGDQFQPPQNVDQMVELQNGMYAAGLYKGDFVRGSWGPSDVDAYETLLSMANWSGTDSKTALDNRLNAVKTGKQGKRQAPLVVQHKSDDDIKAIIQDSSSGLFGKYLGDDEVNKFLSAYHADETAAATAAYAASGYDPATGVETGATPYSTTVQGPPETAGGINRRLETQMFQDKPTEAGESVFSSKLNLILQGLSGRGNTP